MTKEAEADKTTSARAYLSYTILHRGLVIEFPEDIRDRLITDYHLD